jgi:hypothetical protein
MCAKGFQSFLEAYFVTLLLASMKLLTYSKNLPLTLFRCSAVAILTHEKAYTNLWS